MNQILGSPTSDAGSAIGAGLTARREIKSPEEADAGHENAMDSASAESFSNGRLLLLEADPCFRETITEGLAESGYEVVAVQSGPEGLRKILADDFAAILYDPMMPGLGSDEFYNSVGRIDPELCQRFVFMTCDLVDAPTEEFIRKVNGFVLRKPFCLEDLLDSLAFAEVRGSFRSVFEHAPSKPALSRACRLAGDAPTAGIPDRQENARLEKVATRLDRPQADPARGGPSLVVPASEPRPQSADVSWLLVAAGIVLPVILVSGLWFAHWDARDRLAIASAEREARKREWAAISQDLDKTAAVRRELETSRAVSAMIAAEEAKPRWTPALHCIVPPGNAEIEILEIQAHEGPTDPGACEMVVRGVARGVQARMVADRYRRTLEDSMKRNANGRSVSTHLNQIEDVPRTHPEQSQATFTVTAKFGAMERKVAMSREDR